MKQPQKTSWILGLLAGLALSTPIRADEQPSSSAPSAKAAITYPGYADKVLDFSGPANLGRLKAQASK